MIFNKVFSRILWFTLASTLLCIGLYANYALLQVFTLFVFQRSSVIYQKFMCTFKRIFFLFVTEFSLRRYWVTFFSRLVIIIFSRHIFDTFSYSEQYQNQATLLQKNCKTLSIYLLHALYYNLLYTLFQTMLLTPSYQTELKIQKANPQEYMDELSHLHFTV